MKTKMNICLWYDTEAETAAKLYVSVFKNASIGAITRYGKEGYEIHGRPEGSVMTVEFKINDMEFIGLNGGPIFKFNQSASVVVNCDTQQEIDYYWEKLTENGGEEGPCGWLKDRFGLSWQITPSILSEMPADTDAAKVQRVTHAYLQMKKFDIAKLKQAYNNA